MASPDPADRNSSRQRFRDLLSVEMLCLAWLPVLAIAAFHYGIGPHFHGAHDVLRRLYYVPILFAAFSRGLPGGLSVAVVSSLTYLPHAFLVMPASQDPGTTLNKLLEVVLYNLIGLLAGVLADRESARRRQAEEAFAEQRRMAEQLIRAGRLAALGELVAGIAHEIKNPLHTIKGTAEIVDELIPEDAEQAPMWRLMRQEIERLDRVSERFLSFARPSFPCLKPSTLERVYQRVTELVTAQVHSAAQVRLEVVPLASEDAQQHLQADGDQIAQMVLNITANALKAMDGEGLLRVSCSLRNDRAQRFVALRIENDGPAIPVENLERIFDPFYTRSKGGTGLGLAIAERIAEEHGGFLEVCNTGKERGVAFTVVLPQTPEAAVPYVDR